MDFILPNWAIPGCGVAVVIAGLIWSRKFTWRILIYAAGLGILFFALKIYLQLKGS